jgi:hypothetical protein
MKNLLKTLAIGLALTLPLSVQGEISEVRNECSIEYPINCELLVGNSNSEIERLMN